MHSDEEKREILSFTSQWPFAAQIVERVQFLLYKPRVYRTLDEGQLAPCDAKSNLIIITQLIVHWKP